ncbi:cytochrome c oxidase subunit II [Sciscionella marina]|uniref:aa3-type cytochrome oxidase subunit II n=1 Tax=Sciscionella marina TaxID=508770 RepID=UPI0003A9A3E9
MSRNRGTRAGRATKLAVAMGVAALAATGCSGQEALRFGWPEGVTPQSDSMVTLWTWSVIAALIVGVIVWALMLWPVIAHRRKGDTIPRQFQYNHSLEAFYIIVPLIMVAVLFYFTVDVQNKVEKKVPNPDVKVNVVGFQWNWQFEYPDYKTPDGRTVTTTGTSQEIPLLVLPSNKTVNYDLRSNDVIHSFFVPQFHFKRDVFPQPEKNNQDHSFQNSIDRPGSFVGRCAELCGTYHSMMNFEVRALPDNEFKQYMDLRTKTNPATNKPYTAAEALTTMNCGELCVPHAVTTKPFDTDRTVRQESG